MRKSILLLLCSVFLLWSSNLFASPIEWSISDGGNGHYYEAILISGGISWQNAKIESENLGGYLATISGQNENNFIFSLINSSQYWISNAYGPWLGGTDKDSEGNWQWLNNEGSFTYTAWEGGQPDDQYNPQYEDFLHYYSNTGPKATWNDQYSGEPNRPDFINAYIVEFDSAPVVPEPTTILLFGVGLIGIAGVSRKK